jgi:protein ImuB
MLWAALLPDDAPSDPSRRTEVLDGLATWGLQFSPRVAVIEACGVVMEVEASARLFGGKRKLVEQVRAEAEQLGVSSLSWAPTSLAALALARCGVRNGFVKPLQDTLDALPLGTLTAVATHEATLARLGCKTLGDVRALPRGGLSRRFDKELLAAMDTAYGLRPDSHRWKTMPDEFHAKLELMSRVEVAPAILFGARRLLLQMCGWLAGRRSGVTAFTLKWCHDVMRARTAGDGGELTIRTATATRNLEHLSRLLAENLAKVELLAPVGDLELIATEVHDFHEVSDSLLPDAERNGESLALVLERIAARLGPEKVLRPVMVEDHRVEWAVHWQPAPQPQPRQLPEPRGLPQPTFVLDRPLKLAIRGQFPMYQGPLKLLSGPHRVEGGWWHRVKKDDTEVAQTVYRDYWVALSEHAGVLWVFQTRLADERSASWFLQGTFA